jgi:hypothetical protein
MNLKEVTRSDLRNLSRGPEVDSHYDELSPERDDIRKRTQYSGSRGSGSTGYSDLSDKDLYGNHPKYASHRGMTGEFKDFAKLFFDEAIEKGFKPEVVVDNYGYNLVIKTSNGVMISIAGNAGSKLPSKFRAYISQTDNKDLNKKKEELYTALRKVYNLSDTAFTKNGPEYFMDGGKPSLSLGNGSAKERLENFFKVVPYIQDMGNVAYRATGGSSKELISRVSTPSRYYLGAASLIFIATRFGLPHLMPRTDGDSGTFDIKNEFITVGITDAGYADYEAGRPPYYEHAVPVNVIKKEAIKMINDNKSGKLLDEELIMKIATMIRRNLLIVRTGHEESKDMDKIHQQTMPEPWNPLTGDPLKRFTDLGIKVHPIGGGKRLRESNK